MKRTSHNYCSREEEQEYIKQFKELKKEYYKENNEYLEDDKKRLALPSSLLDSSLITQTKSKIYDIKVVECGEYKQIYYFNDLKIKKDENLLKTNRVDIDINYLFKTKPIKEEIKPINNKMKKLGIKKIDYKKIYHRNLKIIKKDKIIIVSNVNYLFSTENNKNTEKQIEIKNLNRSKFNCQRIIKANEKEWKTFITLTFANFKKVRVGDKQYYYLDLCKNYNKKILIRRINIYNIINKKDFNNKIENYSSIKKANKTFNSWKTYIKRLKDDFKYICVPEFQKNGTIHYHLLTNINYTDFSLLSKEEVKIYKPRKGWQIFRTIKGWKYGFSSVKPMEDINVVGYLLKYMTKDIDNRLFGHRRYFYSQNLITPKETYLNAQNNTQDILLYLKFINETNIVYENTYYDKLGNEIRFVELKQS